MNEGKASHTDLVTPRWLEIGHKNPDCPASSGTKTAPHIPGRLFENVKLCPHSNEEDRTICGTWTLIEIQAALHNGYIIKDITEMHIYPETSQDIFRDYIDTFFKIKIANSGWPSGVDQDDYLETLASQGVHLDRTSIQNNPGLRTVAKLGES
jgi:hypothetical protein